jgi:Fe2+ transport system protein FeoA
VARNGADIAVPLTALTRGSAGVVQPGRMDADDERALAELGIRPNASVRVCRKGNPCIVAVHEACGHGCRVGLCRRLAERVLVSPA